MTDESVDILVAHYAPAGQLARQRPPKSRQAKQ
jgi:hypothetical protein